ncbi:hypothetical protein WICPIJ_002554 [Wickerhamomyces pijperi]|uniref:Uncharacterized protein n=1 Tax=Wickerhamomyces pijperi TaxID=599730 RepID=A0A9P8Q9H1_WICPI|nr:hypothetical protein WICPIJ_002554 [Wickerhamomyces pijperi]
MLAALKVNKSEPGSFCSESSLEISEYSITAGLCKSSSRTIKPTDSEASLFLTTLVANWKSLTMENPMKVGSATLTKTLSTQITPTSPWEMALRPVSNHWDLVEASESIKEKEEVDGNGLKVLPTVEVFENSMAL